MKSEFVVSKIESSQDEMKKIPFVMLYSITITPRRENQQQSPFEGTGTAFTSPEDLMKNQNFKYLIQVLFYLYRNILYKNTLHNWIL